MEFVTELIAIGNWRDAQNIAALKEARIEAVVCVANWVRMPRKHYKRAGIIARKLSIDDSTPLPPKKEKELLSLLNFVDTMVLARRRCLVHCAAGISRSAAFIAVWLHTRLGLDYDEAIAYIQRVRPIVDPNLEPFRSMKKIVDTQKRRPKGGACFQTIFDV